MFTSNSTEWATPREFVKNYQREHRIKFFLDVAATGKNTVAPYYLDKQLNCLSVDWWENVDRDPRKWIWMNPPYGRSVGSFLAKAVFEAEKGCSIVTLLPSRTGTNWCYKYIWERASLVQFVKGRIKFIGAPSSAPFDSVVAVFEKKRRKRIGREVALLTNRGNQICNSPADRILL